MNKYPYNKYNELIKKVSKMKENVKMEKGVKMRRDVEIKEDVKMKEEIEEIIRAGNFQKRTVKYEIKGYITAMSWFDIVVLDVVDKVLTPEEYEEIIKNPLRDYNSKRHKQIMSTYLYVIRRVEYSDYGRRDISIITKQEIDLIRKIDEKIFKKYSKMIRQLEREFFLNETIY
jgi:hypothetical protein